MDTVVRCEWLVQADDMCRCTVSVCKKGGDTAIVALWVRRFADDRGLSGRTACRGPVARRQVYFERCQSLAEKCGVDVSSW